VYNNIYSFTHVCKQQYQYKIKSKENSCLAHTRTPRIDMLHVQRINHHNGLDTNMDMEIHKNIHLGYDERYVHYYTNISSTMDKKQLLRISKYFDVLEKIKKLYQVNVSGPYQVENNDDTNKILHDELSYNDIHAFRIKSGGLLTDW
jgi:hypothetical protein